MAGTACHVYQRGNRYFQATGYPADALKPGRELWVLHPTGDPMPEPAAMEVRGPWPRPTALLLDGSWRQAGKMLASMHDRRRCVLLPVTETSEPGRYWLRDQAKPEQLCTAEALMGVLEAVGEPEAARKLRLHFGCTCTHCYWCMATASWPSDISATHPYSPRPPTLSTACMPGAEPDSTPNPTLDSSA